MDVWRNVLETLQHLPEPFRMGIESAAELGATVVRVLDNRPDWDLPGALACAMSRPPRDGVDHPARFLAKRFRDLPPGPRQALSAPFVPAPFDGHDDPFSRPQRPVWCGRCDQDTRITQEPNGAMSPCLLCHPDAVREPAF